MGSVFRAVRLMALLHRVSTPDPNDVLPRGVGSRVKTNGDAHEVGVSADQGETPAVSTDVESKSSHL